MTNRLKKKHFLFKPTARTICKVEKMAEKKQKLLASVNKWFPLEVFK